MAVAQQEAAQLLTCLTQAPHRRQTRTHEIADCLVGSIWDPDRGQFTRPVQLRKVDRIPPIRLDPVTRLARDQRRRDDDASVPGRAQLSMNAVAARSRLITEPQFMTATTQLRDHRRHGSRTVRDLAILTHFTPLARLGERHRNRILVNIQADVGDRLFHDPSPMHEARHRSFGATLGKPA